MSANSIKNSEKSQVHSLKDSFITNEKKENNQNNDTKDFISSDSQELVNK